MTDWKILAVKNSWSYIIVNAEEMGKLFYERLFELDPSLRELFNKDIKPQSKKLTDMVTLTVAKLQKLKDIEQEIKSLGRRHTGYGTKVEHYQTVGQALLWTLEQGLGNRWNDETKEAWTEVYQILSSAMIKAAQAPAPDRASL